MPSLRAVQHTRDMAHRPNPARAGAVLSTQVSGSRYFFLDVTGANRAGVTPAYGGFEQCDPDYVVQREHFDFCALELVAAGEGTVRLNGVETPLRAGGFFHYDHTTRLEIHTDPARPMAKYFLCLTGAKARARLRAAGIRPGSAAQLAMFPEVQRLWEDIIRDGQHAGGLAREICAALLQVLLLKIEQGLAGRATGADPAEDTFLRCKALIDAQADRLASLSELAAQAGVEASSICRLFQRYQGTSPYQYLLRRKMNLAAGFLVESGGLVKEAALRVGFADPYHFSRCFKSVHGVAPSDLLRYRRAG